jgi:hypothetical protein
MTTTPPAETPTAKEPDPNAGPNQKLEDGSIYDPVDVAAYPENEPNPNEPPASGEAPPPTPPPAQ